MKYIKHLGFLLMTCANLNAQTIQVANNQSIQDAIDGANSGDTILLLGNLYRPTSPITITNIHGLTIEASDETIISGDNATNNSHTSWGGLIHIKDSNNINISNVKIEDSQFAGFFVENSHDITIEDSSTNRTFSSGIGIWDSNDTYIISNIVVDACNGGGEESISIAHSKYIEVINNDVSNNTFNKENNAGREPIQIGNYWDIDNGSGGEGIDIKDGSQNVLVQENKVHHLYLRTGIYVDAWNKETRNIQIIDNHVHHNSNAGISVASERGGHLHHVQIIDNFIHNNSFAGINIKGSFNNEPIDGQGPIYENPRINHVDIKWNTIENNGQGVANELLQEKNLTGLQGGEGGLSFGNAPSKYIIIKHNQFIDNKTDVNSNTVTYKGAIHTFPQINFQSGTGSGIVTLKNSVEIKNNQWNE